MVATFLLHSEGKMSPPPKVVTFFLYVARHAIRNQLNTDTNELP